MRLWPAWSVAGKQDGRFDAAAHIVVVEVGPPDQPVRAAGDGLGRQGSRHRLVAYLLVGRAFGLGSAIVGGPVQPDGIGASACARYATADRRGGAPRIAARRRGGLSFWDPISPPKPYLGEPLHSLLCTLGQAIGQRCRLTTGTPEAYTARKQADRLATVSEAFYVVGCSRAEIRDYLEIQLDPVSADPVPPPSGAPSMVAVPALMFRRCRTSTG